MQFERLSSWLAMGGAAPSLWGGFGLCGAWAVAEGAAAAERDASAEGTAGQADGAEPACADFAEGGR